MRNWIDIVNEGQEAQQLDEGWANVANVFFPRAMRFVENQKVSMPQAMVALKRIEKFTGKPLGFLSPEKIQALPEASRMEIAKSIIAVSLTVTRISESPLIGAAAGMAYSLVVKLFRSWWKAHPQDGPAPSFDNAVPA